MLSHQSLSRQLIFALLSLIFPQCKISEQTPGDGLDNDCDDSIDEEVFDGKDNDGDGKIDEDLELVSSTLMKISWKILKLNQMKTFRFFNLFSAKLLNKSQEMDWTMIVMVKLMKKLLT